MKVTVTRLLDVSQYLSTEAGKQLEGMLTYLAEFVENSVRALRSGLSFADNFDCQVVTVTLSHGVASNVSLAAGANGAGRAVQDVIVTRVVSTAALDSFAWYYDDNNRLTFKASFSPAPTSAVQVRALCLF